MYRDLRAAAWFGLVLLGTAVWSAHTQGLDDCKADIAFVMDGSGSMKINNFILMKQFVRDFAAKLAYGPDKSNFGVVTFGNAAKLEIKLNQYPTAAGFSSAVSAIKYPDENTDTYSGLNLMRTKLFTSQNGDRKDAPNLAILVTDGVPTRNVDKTLPETKAVRDAGIALFAVGIGKELNRTELVLFVGGKEEYVYYATDFEDLVASVEKVLSSSCQMVGPTPTPTCNNLDVVFALDASGSVGEDNYRKIVQVTKGIVSDLKVGPGSTQVGIVRFSSEAFLDIQLGQYNTVSALNSALDRLEWVNQMTNISGAIRTARTKMFNTPNDRSAPNVVIIMTDGNANREAKLTVEEARLLRVTGTKIYVVGIGSDLNVKDLVALASKPTFFYFNLLADYADLLNKQKFLVQRICVQRPPPVLTPPPPGSCGFDVAAILHEPTGNQATFTKMMGYLINIVSTIDFGVHRFAMVVLGNSETVTKFGDQSSRSALLQAMRNIRYSGTTRSPSQAFDKALSQVFTSGSALSGRPRVILFISPAGTSSDISDLRRASLRAQASGIKVVVLEVGRPEISQSPDLSSVASKPTELFYHQAPNINSLEEIQTQMLTCLCLAIGRSEVVCEFETSQGSPSLCSLSQATDDNFDWTLNTGATASRHTGPAAAKTGTHYVYMEASEPRRLGDMAELRLPRMTRSGPVCLTFYYHMRGYNTGRLEVYMRSSTQEGRYWMMSGHQGDQWLLGMVTLNLATDEQLCMRAVRGEAFNGDIALDHIVLLRGSCPTVTINGTGLMLL